MADARTQKIGKVQSTSTSSEMVRSKSPTMRTRKGGVGSVYSLEGYVYQKSERKGRQRRVLFQEDSVVIRRELTRAREGEKG